MKITTIDQSTFDSLTERADTRPTLSGQTMQMRLLTCPRVRDGGQVTLFVSDNTLAYVLERQGIEFTDIPRVRISRDNLMLNVSMMPIGELSEALLAIANALPANARIDLSLTVNYG